MNIFPPVNQHSDCWNITIFNGKYIDSFNRASYVGVPECIASMKFWVGENHRVILILDAFFGSPGRDIGVPIQPYTDLWD